MTWSPGANYASALAERNRKDLFAVEFDGHSTVYTSGVVDSATWTYKQILRVHEIDPGGVDTLTGELLFAEAHFSLTNDGDEAWDLIATDDSSATFDSLAGVNVKLYHGFDGLAQADWEVIATLRVESIKVEQYGRVDFVAVDPFTELNGSVFSSMEEGVETSLQDWISPGDTDIDVSESEDFEVGDAICIYLDGYYEFTTITAISVDDPGLGATVTHTITINDAAGRYFRPYNTRIIKCLVLEGHPVNILMRVLLNDFATSGTIQTNWPLDSALGNFGDDDGLGIDSTLVDTSSIQSERDDFLESLDGRLVVTRRNDDGRVWLQDYVRGLGNLIVQRGGNLSFIGAHLPVGAAPATLGVGNASDFTWERRLDEIVNTLIIEGNLVAGEKEVISEEEDADSVTAVGRRDMTISPPWLWSDKNGDTAASLIVGRYMARFSLGYQETRALAHLSLLTVEPGDLLAVTHPHLPNTGAQGESMSSATHEVLSATPILDSGHIEILARRYAAVRLGLITLDTQVDFASASEVEKNTYAFITQDDGTMPDGSEGYAWL